MTDEAISEILPLKTKIESRQRSEKCDEKKNTVSKGGKGD